MPHPLRLSYADLMGRTLIALGILLIIAGLAIEFARRLPFRIGRLPGDIVIHRHHSTFYFPIVTCIVLSLVLTFVMWLINRR